MQGCSLLSEQPCFYACVNLTGGWIAGVCKIGKVISDYIVSTPLTANENSARTSILSGYRCEFSGFDSYSMEPIEVSGKIPRLPSGLEHPYLLLYLKRGKEIECEWKSLERAPRRLELAENAPSRMELQPMLVLAPSTSRSARASFRQRPERFGGSAATTWASQPKGTVQNSFVLYVASATRSHETLICFVDGHKIGEGPTWRTMFNLRDVPKGSVEDNAYWLETEQDGTYRLGRFQAPSMVERELLEMYANQKLMRPTDFLTGQAQMTPRYTMLLHNGKTPVQSPDLRFPDEM